MKAFFVIILSLITVWAGAVAQTQSDSLASLPVSEEQEGVAVETPLTPLLNEYDLTEMADSAYSADNFSLAEQLYGSALAEFGSSSVLFYNLGNTYYRLGNLGKAIVCYERALKIDPTNADAETNLEFVKSKITDRQEIEGGIFVNLWKSIVTTFEVDTWAWIAVALFALFLSGIVVYLFSSVVMVRKISFFGGALLFILCVVAVFISFAAANRVDDNSYAIILTPSSQLSTSPREARTQSEEAFLLHEGTKVQVVDSVATAAEGKWYEVKVAGRDRAWIKAADVERI